MQKKRKRKGTERKLGRGASRPTQSQSEDGKQNADTANAKGDVKL
jgi:hypothetical protein